MILSAAMRNLMFEVLALSLCIGCGSVEESDDRPVKCNGAPVDVLTNGNFDAAEPAWRQDPPNLLCGAPRITPNTGAAAACLGGMDGMTNTVSREIALPAGASSARLLGQVCITTQETDAVDHDTVQFDLLDGVAPIAAFGKRTNQQGTAACDFASFVLEAALTGDPETATLRIQSTLDAQNPTSFFVDSLVLTVACTP